MVLVIVRGVGGGGVFACRREMIALVFHTRIETNNERFNYNMSLNKLTHYLNILRMVGVT